MDVLKTAVERGIIDLTALLEQVEEMENNEFLNQHQQKIWQDPSGRWSTYLPAANKNKRRLVKKTKLDDLEKEIIKYYKDAESSPKFSDVFYEWAGQKLDNGEISRTTYDRYELSMKRFFIPDFRIKNVNEAFLEGFIKKTITKENLTRKGWSDMRILLIGVFKYSKKKGLTSINITTFMDELELPRHLFRKTEASDDESVFTDEEIQMIKDEVLMRPTLIKLGVLLAFQTGMRAGEVSTVKFSDIKENTIHICRTEIRYKENGKNVYAVRESTKGRDGARTIYITESALDTINRIREMNPGEYLMEKNGERILSKAFTRRLYDMCDSLGIKRRSLHKARKTYATMLLDAKVPDKLIMQQMGHTDLSTTLNHYYFNNRTNVENSEIIERAISAI